MRMSWMVLLVGLVSLACGGAVTPAAPRAELRYSVHKVPAVFEGLDLPYHGGRIVMSSDIGMTVSYVPSAATPEQLKRLWPEALVAAGWVETSRGESGNGSLDCTYEVVGGKGRMLSIRPEGTLWWVTLGVL